MTMAIINIIAFCLVAIGGINWGLVGIFNWNLVSAIFGADRNIGTIIVYVLVFLATLWLIFAIFYQKKKILFCPKETEKLEKTKYDIPTNHTTKWCDYQTKKALSFR